MPDSFPPDQRKNGVQACLCVCVCCFTHPVCSSRSSCLLVMLINFALGHFISISCFNYDYCMD